MKVRHTVQYETSVIVVTSNWILLRGKLDFNIKSSGELTQGFLGQFTALVA